MYMLCRRWTPDYIQDVHISWPKQSTLPTSKELHGIQINMTADIIMANGNPWSFSDCWKTFPYMTREKPARVFYTFVYDGTDEI